MLSSHTRATAVGIPTLAGLCVVVVAFMVLSLLVTCYPLTVTDQASRFLLMCEALDTTREDVTLAAFEQ